MSNNLPTKITPCPIIESVAEVIFDRNLDIEPSAVYGKVYDQLRKRYPNVENMPLYQLPEEIRLRDDNLKNKPWHKFFNDEFEVLVGGNIVAIVSKEYHGWAQYSDEIKYVFNVFQDSNISSSISRIGLKYVDMFECPIINKIGISLLSNLSIDENLEIQLRTVLPVKDSLNAILAIMNNVKIEFMGEAKENVSLLDIDVYKIYDTKNSCNYNEAIEILNDAHRYQKELFFNLVGKDFLIKNNYILE